MVGERQINSQNGQEEGEEHKEIGGESEKVVRTGDGGGVEEDNEEFKGGGGEGARGGEINKKEVESTAEKQKGVQDLLNDGAKKEGEEETSNNRQQVDMTGVEQGGEKRGALKVNKKQKSVQDGKGGGISTETGNVRHNDDIGLTEDGGSQQNNMVESNRQRQEVLQEIKNEEPLKEEEEKQHDGQELNNNRQEGEVKDEQQGVNDGSRKGHKTGATNGMDKGEEGDRKHDGEGGKDGGGGQDGEEGEEVGGEEEGDGGEEEVEETSGTEGGEEIEGRGGGSNREILKKEGEHVDENIGKAVVDENHNSVQEKMGTYSSKRAEEISNNDRQGESQGSKGKETKAYQSEEKGEEQNKDVETQSREVVRSVEGVGGERSEKEAEQEEKKIGALEVNEKQKSAMVGKDGDMPPGTRDVKQSDDSGSKNAISQDEATKGSKVDNPQPLAKATEKNQNDVAKENPQTPRVKEDIPQQETTGESHDTAQEKGRQETNDMQQRTENIGQAKEHQLNSEETANLLQKRAGVESEIGLKEVKGSGGHKQEIQQGDVKEAGNEAGADGKTIPAGDTQGNEVTEQHDNTHEENAEKYEDEDDDWCEEDDEECEEADYENWEDDTDDGNTDGEGGHGNDEGDHRKETEGSGEPETGDKHGETHGETGHGNGGEEEAQETEGDGEQTTDARQSDTHTEKEGVAGNGSEVEGKEEVKGGQDVDESEETDAIHKKRKEDSPVEKPDATYKGDNDKSQGSI